MTQSSVAAKDTTSGLQRLTDGLWNHLGKLIVGNLVVTRTVSLPTGAVTEDMLAPGAASAQIGSFAQGIAWTLPQSNVWTETPVAVTGTGQGLLTRVEFTMLLGCPTKGQRVFWGLMLDGAPPERVLGAADAPENNYGMMASGTYYATSSPGMHRLAIGLYGPAGTQIFGAVPSALYVTEQRR